MSHSLLPAFSGDVRLWFSQLDLYFTASDISSKWQQLHILLSSIPPSLANSLKDIIIDTTKDATYPSFKSEIIYRMAIPESKRFCTLICDEYLDGRTPTQLLCRMRELTEDSSKDSSLLKQLFFSCLPSHVQGILTPSMDVTPIDQLALSADRILEYTGNRTVDNKLAAVSPSPSTVVASFQQPDSTQVDTLQAIRELTEQVKNLCASQNSPRQRTFSQSLFPMRCAFPPAPSSDLCWYHCRFGQNARK
ncbi:uncharacterized protein LOC115210455 [Octopus sinensis]|uniref:Uncharacterized protein LOC115210455 n=1 Tax=Octopus sinensis TaxID=2607531 RepID=A0A6P7SA05_9MOLL|nr:uncharacterized protein LOC115210455 [Octopus sinensis]